MSYDRHLQDQDYGVAERQRVGPAKYRRESGHGFKGLSKAKLGIRECGYQSKEYIPMPPLRIGKRT
jgi:hypothetical protein